MPPLAETLVPEPLAPTPFAVTDVHRESHDTVSIGLESPARESFQFRPGQFNMLYAFGLGEVPISISGDPGSVGPIVHTIRDVGAVTHALSSLRAGDHVGLRGPYGSDWHVREAEDHDVVIVAGGIGLAPLRPVVHHLLANRHRYGRISVLYGARTPDDLLFRDQLAQWRSRFDLDVLVTVDSAGDGWRGDVGVVPELIPRASFDPENAVAMVVGPQIMMRFTVRTLQQAGVADERILLSMELNMQCGIGLCGHCQIGPIIVCRDGPVVRYPDLSHWMLVREM